MYFLGVIEIPAEGVQSNRSTAVPFLIDGWPSVAIEPDVDGLRIELGQKKGSTTWQTTAERAATVPTNGTDFIMLGTRNITGLVLSVVNTGDSPGNLRVWGLQR